MASERKVDVEVRGLHKRYGTTVVVESLDLRIEPGEFVALLGPSGCGKTTTLRSIAGLVRPDAGDVRIGGRLMNGVPTHRRGLGLVAQNYALFPHMTVIENVTFGLRMRHVPAAEARRRAEQTLSNVQLMGMQDRYPRQLSGGQQQRVALARCLVIEPNVLLLDEPLGALDKKLREAMQVELKSLQRQVGITTIFVTHDQEEALTMSDRIAVIHQGRLQQLGAPQDIYERPCNRFVADFVGVCNFFDCRIVACDRTSVLVELEGGTRAEASIQPDTAPPAEGRRALLAVRPEKVLLSECRKSDNLCARIENIVYVGTAVHIHLQSAGTRIVSYRQNDRPLPASITQGAEVNVSWDAKSGSLLLD